MVDCKKDFCAPEIVGKMFELVSSQVPHNLFSLAQIDLLAKKIEPEIENDVGLVFGKVLAQNNGPPELCIGALKNYYERLDGVDMQDVFRGSYIASMEYIFSPWPKTNTISFEILSVHSYSGSCRLVVEAVCRDSYLPAKTLGIWLPNDKKLPNFHALINLACHRIILDKAACFKNINP